MPTTFAKGGRERDLTTSCTSHAVEPRRNHPRFEFPAGSPYFWTLKREVFKLWVPHPSWGSRGGNAGIEIPSRAKWPDTIAPMSRVALYFASGESLYPGAALLMFVAVTSPF